MEDDKRDKREKALELTREALEALKAGDKAKADELLEQAKKLDIAAVKEIVADLGEAAKAAKGDGHDFEPYDEQDLETH